MSKAFEKAWQDSGYEETASEEMKWCANVLWNAALEHAAAYIEQQSLPDMYSEPCLKEFAEEIRKEKTE